MLDRQERLEQRVIALETRSAVDDVHRAAVENRLTAIEDTLRWLVRLILGAVVMALMAYALGGGLRLL